MAISTYPDTSGKIEMAILTYTEVLNFSYGLDQK